MDPVYGAKARCEIQPRKTSKERTAIWEKVVADLPNSPGAHAGLAREYMRKRAWGRAAAHVDQTLRLDPSRAIILLELGVRYRRATKHFKEAEEAIQRYMRLVPPPPAALRAYALRELARIHRQQGSQKTAEALTKQANKLEPGRLSPIWPQPADMYVAP